MSQPFLKVRGLSHSYHDDEVFANFKFSLNAGDSVLLQGENGAGKTTILKILSGLLEPTTGEFSCVGLDNKNYKQVKNQLRSQSIYLHQQPFLFDTSVENNLNYACQTSAALSLENKRELVQQLGIDEIMHQNAANLSIGQKQRVALARSLDHNPQLLILDEPFTAIDRESFASAVNVLAHYKRRGGTILLVSHQHDRSFELIETCWCIHPKGVLYCVSAD